MTVVGPGDTDRVRLLMRFGVDTDPANGTVMKIETGDVGQVLWLDVVTRSLASAQELEVRSIGMTREQALLLYRLIGAAL